MNAFQEIFTMFPLDYEDLQKANCFKGWLIRAGISGRMSTTAPKEKEGLSICVTHL